MRKQGASAQQAAWEEQRKKREELESRMSMNKVRCISSASRADKPDRGIYC
jgi:hypothetical protein